ncbi:translation initiation factor IF-2-like [Cervus canadensis]|uniref:translation initiation factor IF-2-like n=1 Tax=Cervus canadensis TaxID=1574408 RepID=UPI001C9E860E|nr:translation initiation factor IF-2-like [Cervus canadensis]
MAVLVSEGRLWAGLPSQVCRPGPRIGTCHSSTDSGRGGLGSQKCPGGGPGGPRNAPEEGPGVPETPWWRARGSQKCPGGGPGGPRNASGEGPGCLQGAGPGPASVLPEEEAGRVASCSDPFPADGGFGDHAPLLSTCGPGAWAWGAHGGQSTGAPASESPGGTHGPLHPPRPRVLHLSTSKRQRGPRHPELMAPSLRPTLGQLRTDGPPLPTLPQRGQARPSRGQTRGCTSHLLSAHRSGPQRAGGRTGLGLQQQLEDPSGALTLQDSQRSPSDLGPFPVLPATACPSQSRGCHRLRAGPGPIRLQPL